MLYLLIALASTLPAVSAFVAPHRLAQHTMTTRHMVDPLAALDGMTAATSMGPIMSEGLASSSHLLSFTDQGQNLAGIFFQASLLPYLLFLYFLSFRANRISDLGNFGFQFVLLFVISTIPSGIISKSVYGETLANVDYLHGGAELLLTVANVLIVSDDGLSTVVLFQ